MLKAILSLFGRRVLRQAKQHAQDTLMALHECLSTIHQARSAGAVIKNSVSDITEVYQVGVHILLRTETPSGECIGLKRVYPDGSTQTLVTIRTAGGLHMTTRCLSDELRSELATFLSNIRVRGEEAFFSNSAYFAPRLCEA